MLPITAVPWLPWLGIGCTLIPRSRSAISLVIFFFRNEVSRTWILVLWIWVVCFLGFVCLNQLLFEGTKLLRPLLSLLSIVLPSRGLSNTIMVYLYHIKRAILLTVSNQLIIITIVLNLHLSKRVYFRPLEQHCPHGHLRELHLQQEHGDFTILHNIK